MPAFRRMFRRIFWYSFSPILFLGRGGNTDTLQKCVKVQNEKHPPTPSIVVDEFWGVIRVYSLSLFSYCTPHKSFGIQSWRRRKLVGSGFGWLTFFFVCLFAPLLSTTNGTICRVELSISQWNTSQINNDICLSLFTILSVFEAKQKKNYYFLCGKIEEEIESQRQNKVTIWRRTREMFSLSSGSIICRRQQYKRSGWFWDIFHFLANSIMDTHTDTGREKAREWERQWDTKKVRECQRERERESVR